MGRRKQRAEYENTRARGGSAAGPRFHRSTQLPAVAAIAAVVIAGRGNAGRESDSGCRYAEGAETATEASAAETAEVAEAMTEAMATMAEAMTETMTEAVSLSGSNGGGRQSGNSGNRQNELFHRNDPSFESQG